MARYADSAQRRELDDIIIVDPATLLEDPGPNSQPSAMRNDAPPVVSAATLLATPVGDPDAVALAMQLFGAPAPLAVTADGMSFTVPGWELGSQSADSMDADGLACWVSVDILLLENGRYVVREHRATEGTDGMIESESNGSVIESGAEARAFCTEFTPDALRAAARGAALDNAMRRWPPLRSPSGRARKTPLVIPFLID
ncbi:MAG TPA: hypothetical protein VIM15_12655 [Gemmatimonadaceae bacterium]